MRHFAVSALLGSLAFSSVEGFRLNVPLNASHLPGKPAYYGDTSCPCVGIDGVLWGQTMVTLDDGSKAPYPADVGARCEAWDDAHDTKHCMEGGTPGLGKGWCAKQWCYVDPCNCHLDTLPKKAVRLPGAEFQGKPVYYSYATCGSTDTWATEEQQSHSRRLDSLCGSIGEIDAKKWGSPFCKCIGVAPQPGTTDVYINGVGSVAYPADAGAYCNAWDQNDHPKCKAANPPHWCEKKWCYVDPCTCELDTPPKSTVYLPGAKFQGTPIYYSYVACGDTDTGDRHGSAEKPAICVKRFPDQNTSWHPPPPTHQHNDTAYGKEWHNEWRNKTM